MTAWRNITHRSPLRFLAVIAVAAVVMAWPSPAVGADELAPPTNLSGTISTTPAVTLTWDAPDGYTPTGYQVLRWRRGGSALGVFQAIVHHTGSTETTYTDTDVVHGARYVYRVKAWKDEALSERSNFFNGDVPLLAPPTNLTGTLSHDSVTLTWDAPEGYTPTGYQIIRWQPEVTSHFDIHLSNTGSTETTYTDTDVKAGAQYAYRVKAWKGKTLSERSEYFYGKLPTPKPPTPTGLTGTVTHDSVTLTWDAPDGNTPTGYQILRLQRGVHELGDFQVLVDDTGSAEATYTDTDVEAEARYVYRVKARNQWGLSLQSNYFNADLPPAPPPVDHGDAEESATSLVLGDSVDGQLDDGDVDLFGIDLQEGDEVWLFTTGDADTSGELRGSGTVVASNDDGWLPPNPLNFAIRAAITASGTYYVAVQGGPGPYTLHARTVTVAGDSTTTAPVITPGQPVAATLEAGAQNYFRIELTEATDLWALGLGDASTNGELLDGQGQRIFENFESKLHKREEQFTLRSELEPGTYYLKVWGDGANTEGPYVLWVEGVTAPGNSLADATRAYLGMPVPGRATTSDALDFFRIDLPVRTELIVRGVGNRGRPSPTVPNLTVALYDSDGTDLDVYFLPHSALNSYLGVAARGILPAGTYYVSMSAKDDKGGAYLLDAFLDDSKLKQEEKCLALGSGKYSDPLYGCQWHLKNTGQYPGGAGKDINVEPVWDSGNLGQGINVAIFEGGVDSAHDDLKHNYREDLSHSSGGGRVRSPGYYHGTNVAGVIAARDNDIGGRGVAPRATLFHYRTPPNEAVITAAMIRNLDITAVHNNSWSVNPTGHLRLASAAWERAVIRGVTEGYGGKGIVYVFAAGNADSIDSHVNLDERGNHYATLSACAVNYNDVRSPYSETGDALWVCAPTDDKVEPLPKITTTGGNNSYTTSFGGTSAAAPIVSGVAALVRAANPSLTWRDVKLILAGSARKSDPTSETWQEGELKYGSSSDRYWYSHHYGFGTVDAGAAVALAESWTNLPTFKENSATDSQPAQIQDAHSREVPGIYLTKTLTLDPYVEFVEFVAVELTMTHDRYRQLCVELISPTGTISLLGYPETRTPFILFGGGGNIELDDDTVRLGSARFMGEPSAGTWTLRIRDERPSSNNHGTLHSWKLTVYGHGSTPGYTAVTSLAPGNGTIAVAWEAPEDIGGSAVTSYNLRYRQAGVEDWTVTGVGLPEGLTATLTGLAGGYEHEVQVRAVNSSGPGPWSESMSAATSSVLPQVPTRHFAIPRDASLEIRWSAPEHDGGSELTGYEVRYIQVADFKNAEDTDWTYEPAVSGSTMTHMIIGLENGTKYYVQVRARNSNGPAPGRLASREPRGRRQTASSGQEQPLPAGDGKVSSALPDPSTRSPHLAIEGIGMSRSIMSLLVVGVAFLFLIGCSQDPPQQSQPPRRPLGQRPRL